MTLAEFRRLYPHLFYPQDWYEGHAFMQREESVVLEPDCTLWTERVKSEPVYAVDLVRLFLSNVEHPRWRYFLWTDDQDDHGNRIYVGGLGQFGCKGFQVHRLLKPNTERWRWVVRP